ncbi:MAG: GTPase ObgE [Bacteriovoracaceae bacterium]
MKFIDEVKISVSSGHGGPGAISFRREKYIPFGGPDGGDGGRGADVYIATDLGLNTLLHIRGVKDFKAEDGVKGGTNGRCGRDGNDLILKVPVGTLVYDDDNGLVLFDLNEENQVVKIAEGGKGGKGNLYFQTSINRSPDFCQDGLPGVSLNLRLELKLLAQVALVGLPNAGKSTLISSISNAKPKIADYPFTTLEPHLGIVRVNESDTVVVADIPGLIEGAHLGKGLGIKFLKHIERTKVLLHLVDVSYCLDEFEALESYMTVREELAQYDENLTDKREIVCLTKIDALSEDEIVKFQRCFEENLQKKVVPISAVSGRNIDFLKQLLLRVVKEDKKSSNDKEEQANVK